MMITARQLAASLDSTNLRLDASKMDIANLCDEVAREKFACAMIYPASVSFAASIFTGTDARIGTVIGFPSGRFSIAAKAAEITAAHEAGAHEVDIVMNYSLLGEHRGHEVEAELKQLTALGHGYGQIVKIIVETCFLTQEQKLTALRICEEIGADFIKTSTGFGSAGAKVEDIALWAGKRRGNIQIKASGGIKTLNDARTLLDAGAMRLGTSAAGSILKEYTSGQAATATRAGY
jgi:deoxyribose-phosphate aldolase